MMTIVIIFLLHFHGGVFTGGVDVLKQSGSTCQYIIRWFQQVTWFCENTQTHSNVLIFKSLICPFGYLSNFKCLYS